MDFAYIYIVDFDGKLVILVGKLYSCPSHGSENGKFPLKPNSNLSMAPSPKKSPLPGHAIGGVFRTFQVSCFQNLVLLMKLNPEVEIEGLVLPPPGIRGLIAGLIKGNQWVFINPKNKAGYFFGGVALGGYLRFP